MLETYRKQFEEIMKDEEGLQRDLKLSVLMSQMESYYRIPMGKERFEYHIGEDIRKLYLSISNSRRL